MPPPDSINLLDQPPYSQTKVPDDTSRDLLKGADLLHTIVSVDSRFSATSQRLKFSITPLFHDTTVYYPNENEVYFSELSGGDISQNVID